MTIYLFMIFLCCCFQWICQL